MQARNIVARYSSRDKDDGAIGGSAVDDSRSRRNAGVFNVGNLFVVVLMVVLILLSALLPVMAWQGSVDERDRKAADEFRASVNSHAVAIKEAMSAAVNRLVQYEAFLQQIRTLDSFVQYASRDSEGGGGKMWLPRVLHSERAAFEARVTQQYRDFFNDSSIVFDINDYVLVDGNPSGFVTAPVRSEYFPIDFFGGVEVIPRIAGRDLSSEPTRGAAISRARSTRETEFSTRILVVSGAGPVVVSVLTVRAVFAFGNASHLLGMVATGLRPDLTFVEAADEIAPVSLHMRVFDVTGSEPDQTGCLKPMLFDGVRSPDGDGPWTINDISSSYCPAEPRDLIEDDDLTAEVEVGSRSWLLIFRRGPKFDGSDDLDTDTLVAAGILAGVAMILVVGVLMRGWWLIGTLRESEKREHDANERSKEFLSFITHELRNPLFGLLGSASELSSAVAEFNLPDTVGRLASGIELSAERMSSIIDGVLNVRKLEEGKIVLGKSNVAPEVIVQEVYATFAHRATRKQIELGRHIKRDVPQNALVDAGRVVQILSNFLSNAIKFTPNGGKIELVVRTARRPRWYKEERKAQRKSQRNSASVSPSPGAVHWLRFDVHDTGEGISEEDMERIFSPYVQAKDRAVKSGGTGLGLSICEQLAACMEGEIRVVSEVGKGSCFSLLLPVAWETLRTEPRVVLMGSDRKSPHTESVPLSDNPSDAASNSQGTPRAWSHGMSHRSQSVSSNKCALVVDNEHVGRTLATGLFKRFMPEVHVDEAKNGTDGFQMVSDRHDAGGSAYILVLVDVTVPETGGLELVKALRTAGHTMPVVALADASDAETCKAHVEAGFTATARKPLRSGALLRLVSKHVERQW